MAPNLIVGVGGRGAGGSHWSVIYPPPPPTPPQPSPRSHPRPHPRPHLPPQISPPLLSPPQLQPQPPPPHHAIITPTGNNHQSTHMDTNLIHYANSNSHLYQGSPYHQYLPPMHATPAIPLLPPTEPHQPPHQRINSHQRIPILYSAQTQNVLSISVPTPESHSAWSFPVNVIPRVNATSSRHQGSSVLGGFDAKHRQMLNPLIVPPYSPTSNQQATGGSGGNGLYGSSSGHSGHTSDNSRAASVLGNAGAGWYGRSGQVSAISSSSSSAAAASAGDTQQSMYSLSKIRLFLYKHPKMREERKMVLL